MKLTAIVKDIDSARSPFDRSVIRLESIPPGHVASSTKPTANSGVGAYLVAMTMPTSGGTISIAPTPTSNARRSLNTRWKSCQVRLRPIENMIAHSDPGNATSSIRFMAAPA